MPKKQPLKKLYVVRKYVMAKSAKDAIRRERRHTPDDVWLDDEFRKMGAQDRSSAIGFMASSYEDEYDE